MTSPQVGITPHVPPGAPKSRRFDIQGLRVIAVLSVVAYHFSPTRLTGGFVGVDVFFVISGYLITLILLREFVKTGRISFAAFYARRVRRLLPAASLVIVVTLVFSYFLVGKIRFHGYLTDAIYAALSAANIRFAQDPTGYFAVVDPSPFQHFWSLAVEEQFYFVWPLALMGVLLFRRRGVAIASVAMGLVCVVTFVVSVYLTQAQSSHAYYSLGSRAWELMIGAAVALLVTCDIHVRSRLQALTLLTVGLAAIFWSILTYDHLTAFPGPMALVPVLGTAAVILAGAGSHGANNYFAVISQFRPIRLIGDASYSIYLWHWPIVVLGPIAFTVLPRFYAGYAILVSIACGVASYYFVELPTNRAPQGRHFKRALRNPTTRTLTAGFMGTAALVGGAFLLIAVVPTGLGAPIRTTDNSSVTAAIGGPGRNEIILSGSLVTAGTKVLPANISPKVADLKTDLAAPIKEGCLDFGKNDKPCTGGDPQGTRTVVLTGDSHAGHLYPAVDAAAKANHWKLVLLARNSCTIADFRVTFADTSNPWPECDAWQKQALKTIETMKPDLVIYANNALLYQKFKKYSGDFNSVWKASSERTLKAIAKHSRVLYIGQFPWQKQEPTTCISQNTDNLQACQTPLAKAVPPSLVKLDLALAQSIGATYFDLSQAVCVKGVCPMVSGNVIVDRDWTHMTVSFAKSLSSFMGQAMLIAMET